MSGRPARASSRGARRLGLPPSIRACLFDVDGVLTPTAAVQAAAWKQTLDAFLRTRARRPFAPFDLDRDYRAYVDGRARAAGVAAFLASRGIELPPGTADDPAGAPTGAGLGRLKHDLVVAALERDGVEAYPGSIAYVRAALDAGLRCAVVSGSTSCERVLDAAGIADLFEARVDGVVTARERLRGKPAPDAYLAAARALGVEPAASAVFEDALAGVEAARAGGFGYVVAVDRAGDGEALLDRGADVVVADLGELIRASTRRSAGR